MEFSFIHAADLHLGSPFEGFRSRNPKLQERLRQSTFAALTNLVDLCLHENVDFLLLAGDVYDDDYSLKAQMMLNKELRRLSDAGIKTFIVHGNHDYVGGWRASLDWPESVHFFGSSEVDEVQVTKNGLHIASVFGISYDSRHVHESLVKHFPKPTSPFNIGLLHCNVGGFSSHGNYAPCTLEELKQSGYDYWALGHVHSPQILSEEPMVMYPGSLQGRTPLETGPRGCYLSHVSEGRTATTFVPVDDVRWENSTIDISKMISLQDLYEELESTHQTAGRYENGCIMRVKLVGSGPISQELNRPGSLDDILSTLQSSTLSFDYGFTWIDTIEAKTTSELDPETLKSDDSFLGDFLRYIGDAKSDPDLLAEMRQELSSLFDHPNARSYLSGYQPDQIKALLDGIGELGLRLLTGAEVI